MVKKFGGKSETHKGEVMGETKQGFFANFFKGLAKQYGRKVAFGLFLGLAAILVFGDAIHVANADATKCLELVLNFFMWLGGIVVAGNMSEHISKGFGGKDKVSPPAEEAPQA